MKRLGGSVGGCCYYWVTKKHLVARSHASQESSSLCVSTMANTSDGQYSSSSNLNCFSSLRLKRTPLTINHRIDSLTIQLVQMRHMQKPLGPLVATEYSNGSTHQDCDASLIKSTHQRRSRTFGVLCAQGIRGRHRRSRNCASSAQVLSSRHASGSLLVVGASTRQ